MNNGGKLKEKMDEKLGLQLVVEMSFMYKSAVRIVCLQKNGVANWLDVLSGFSSRSYVE
jgi:hypothetical protein